MLTDALIRQAAGLLWNSIDVPALSMPGIERSMARRRLAMAEPAKPRPLTPAIAIAALAFALLPVLAYSVVSYETRSRAALEARGGWAPPRPPAAFFLQLQPRDVTLVQARNSLSFTLVEPGGLPAEARLSKIEVGPVGVYDRVAKTWAMGRNEAIFRYTRRGNDFFNIVIQPYDASDLPGRFIFSDEGPDASGKPTLVRYENFAWRNGGQLTQITAGTAIDAREIQEIARAMNGTLLTLPWPDHGNTGTLHLIM